jgi:hypothetical protein
MSEDSACKSEEIQVPCLPSGQSSHPVRTPLCPLFHPSGRRVIPSGHQTIQYHPSRRRAPSIRTLTLYREVSIPACIRPDVSAARLDASQFLNGSLILSKFQEREDQSTVWTMWYPVWTRVSIRQESQFKINGPDVWQPWSGCAFIKDRNYQFDFNHPDACPSWSGRRHCRYGNCVLKNCRPDVTPPWSGRPKPYMEITCHGRATVLTTVSHRPNDVLILERFSAKFLKNPVALLPVRTAQLHNPDGVLTYYCSRPFCTSAYK